MIPGIPAFFPVLRHSYSLPVVFFRHFFLSQPACQQGKRLNPHNGLGGQIHIVGQMPRKVIGTQLFSRIRPISQQIFTPFLQHLKIRRREVRRTILFAYRRSKYQHIAAFLHRHLVSEIINSAACRILIKEREHTAVASVIRGTALFPVQPVYLARGIRITPDIMRGEVKLPHIAGGKRKYRTQHSLYIFRIVKQIQRR